MSSLNLKSLTNLEDLDLPSMEDLSYLKDPLLRFFDDDEHIMGDNCPCLPHILPSHKSKSGLVLVHHTYNMVSRDSLCSLD